MQTIHKQVLAIRDHQKVMVAAGSKFLSLQMQNGVPTIWYLTDPISGPSEWWTILCFGTGHPIEVNVRKEFLGTVQMNGGALVFHFFRAFETA